MSLNTEIKSSSVTALKQLPLIQKAFSKLNAPNAPEGYEYTMLLDFLRTIYQSALAEGGKTCLLAILNYDNNTECLSSILDLCNPKLRLAESTVASFEAVLCAFAVLKVVNALVDGIPKGSKLWKSLSDIKVLPKALEIVVYCYQNEAQSQFPKSFMALWNGSKSSGANNVPIFEHIKFFFALEASCLVNCFAPHVQKLGLLLRMQNVLVPVLETLSQLQQLQFDDKTQKRECTTATEHCMRTLLAASKSELNCKVIATHDCFRNLVKTFLSFSSSKSISQAAKPSATKKILLQICSAMLKSDFCSNELASALSLPTILQHIESTYLAMRKSSPSDQQSTNELAKYFVLLGSLLVNVLRLHRAKELKISNTILKKIVGMLKREVEFCKSSSVTTSNASLSKSKQAISSTKAHAKKSNRNNPLQILQSAVLEALPCVPLPFLALLEAQKKAADDAFASLSNSFMAKKEFSEFMYQAFLTLMSNFYNTGKVPANSESSEKLNEPKTCDFVLNAMKLYPPETCLEYSEPLSNVTPVSKAQAVLEMAQNIISRSVSEHNLESSVDSTFNMSTDFDKLVYWKSKKTLFETASAADVAPDIVHDSNLLFDAAFSGGNLQAAFEVAPNRYSLVLENDLCTNIGQHAQWFMFSVKVKKAAKTTFSIINMTKPASQYKFGMQPVLYSARTEKWRRAGEDIFYYRNCFVRNVAKAKRAREKPVAPYYSTLQFTIDFPNDDDTVILAYHYPYTTEYLDYRLSQLGRSATVSFFKSPLCNSCSGLNQINVYTITNLQEASVNANPLAKRPIVVFTGRVHPGESNSSFVVDGLLQSILTSEKLATNYIFHVIPMLNPDGVMLGHHRCSLSGKDLNREWLSPDPVASPEIFYAKKWLAWMAEGNRLPVLYCDFHGHSQKKNIFLYGCPKTRALSYTKFDFKNERKSSISSSRSNLSTSKSAQSLSESSKRTSSASRVDLSARKNPTSGPSSRSVLIYQNEVLSRLLFQSTCLFSEASTTYSIGINKESTARVVLWRSPFGIPLSYTCESTFCGGTRKEAAGFQITPPHLVGFGKSFANALLDQPLFDLLHQLSTSSGIESNAKDELVTNLLESFSLEEESAINGGESDEDSQKTDSEDSDI